MGSWSGTWYWHCGRRCWHLNCWAKHPFWICVVLEYYLCTQNPASINWTTPNLSPCKNTISNTLENCLHMDILAGSQEVGVYFFVIKQLFWYPASPRAGTIQQSGRETLSRHWENTSRVSGVLFVGQAGIRDWIILFHALSHTSSQHFESFYLLFTDIRAEMQKY